MNIDESDVEDDEEVEERKKNCCEIFTPSCKKEKLLSRQGSFTLVNQILKLTFLKTCLDSSKKTCFDTRHSKGSGLYRLFCSINHMLFEERLVLKFGYLSKVHKVWLMIISGIKLKLNFYDHN